MFYYFSLVSLGICIGGILRAQTAPPPGAHEPVDRFEVVAIHSLNPATKHLSSWHVSPAGDLQVHSVPLMALITSAYDVYDFQVVGTPAWVMSESFDVDAKSGDPHRDSKLLLQARLRTLLAERCKLVVEHSARNQTGLALELDRNAPKIKAADPTTQDPQTVRGPFFLKSDRITMPELAHTLSIIVRAPVSDETALSGAFQVELHYSESPEMGERKSSQGDDPDIFGAIREQLGLRLVGRTIRVPTLVVKHVEKPSTN